MNLEGLPMLHDHSKCDESWILWVYRRRLKHSKRFQICGSSENGRIIPKMFDLVNLPEMAESLYKFDLVGLPKTAESFRRFPVLWVFRAQHHHSKSSRTSRLFLISALCLYIIFQSFSEESSTFPYLLGCSSLCWSPETGQVIHTSISIHVCSWGVQNTSSHCANVRIELS